MANEGGEKKKSDFYGVLGLKKECTSVELRNAYKKLALRWHPDRCSASGNLKCVEEAKKKFQSIQEAYSVLSDDNKRLMYDVGVYDPEDDDDENGMNDFLNEMLDMMNQPNSNDNVERSFADLQTLFEEMFQGEIDSFGCGSQNAKSSSGCSTTTPASYTSYFESNDSNHKRNMTEMNRGYSGVEDSNGFGSHYQSFCLGTGGAGSREGDSKRRSSRRTRR